MKVGWKKNAASRGDVVRANAAEGEVLRSVSRSSQIVVVPQMIRHDFGSDILAREGVTVRVDVDGSLLIKRGTAVDLDSAEWDAFLRVLPTIMAERARIVAMKDMP